MKRVYIKQIEERSNEIVNYSKTVVASKIENLKTLPKGFEWHGRAKDSYIKGYDAKIEKLIKYNENIAKLAEIMLIAADSYGNANIKIRNAAEEILMELNLDER